MIRWMPVTRRKDRQAMSLELLGISVEHRNDCIAARHAEGATRKEIVLDVHHDERVSLVQPFRFSAHCIGTRHEAMTHRASAYLPSA